MLLPKLLFLVLGGGGVFKGSNFSTFNFTNLGVCMGRVKDIFWPNPPWRVKKKFNPT